MNRTCAFGKGRQDSLVHTGRQSGQPATATVISAARSTPTVEGTVLYALGSDGDLICLETDKGKVAGKKMSFGL